MPPCLQYNADGDGSQGRRSRAFTLDFRLRQCYPGMRSAKKIDKCLRLKKSTLLAVIERLQSVYRQVYSQQKPLSFLASRTLTMKTVNFFGFDEAEKVEDEVDVASGRCRRKTALQFFAKLYSLTVLFKKSSIFKASSMTVTRL